MNLCLAVILSAFLSTSFAQTEDMQESTSETTTTTKEVRPAKMPKMMKTTTTVKKVKTVGLMKRPLTCESKGRILNEGDGGYRECMKQVKTKKY